MGHTGLPHRQPTCVHACDYQHVPGELSPQIALDDPYGGAPAAPQSRNWPWGPTFWVALVVAWCGVDLFRGVAFFSGMDGYLASVVGLGVIAVAACATIALIGWEISRRQWIKTAGAIILAGALGVGTFVPNWTLILVQGYYDLHQHQFASVANSARVAAPLRQTVRISQPGCDDPVLPPTSLSITGKTDWLSRCTDPVAVYVPRSVLLLEGGAGYGWFGSPPPDDSQYVINDDPGWTCWAVGNGWYWMESGNYPAPTMKGRASHC